MGIKIKNKDPKTTDFASTDLVINRKDGTLFFKSDTSLVKLEPSSEETSYSDSEKIKFGTGDDLEIYHDGNHSYVSDVGTGNLNLRGNNVLLQKADGLETYISCVADSGVTLSHNGNSKFFTNVSGVGVTGEITASGNISASGTSNDHYFGGVLNLVATDPRIRIKAVGANHPGLELYEDSTRKWVIYNDPDENDNLTFKNNSTELVKLDQSGNITASLNISSSGGNIYSNNHESLISTSWYSQYPRYDDPAGNDGAAGDWYGPELRGPNYFHWKENYGDNNQVLVLAQELAHTGIAVPYKCQLVGFRAVISLEEGWTDGNKGQATMALYTGAGDAATFNNTSGTADDLTLVQRCAATTSAPGLASNPMSISVTNGTTELDAGDMIYPRISNSDIHAAGSSAKDIYATLTILIKRAK